MPNFLPQSSLVRRTTGSLPLYLPETIGLIGHHSMCYTIARITLSPSTDILKVTAIRHTHTCTFATKISRWAFQKMMMHWSHECSIHYMNNSGIHSWLENISWHSRNINFAPVRLPFIILSVHLSCFTSMQQQTIQVSLSLTSSQSV